MLLDSVAYWHPSGGAARWCDRRDIHLSIDDAGFRQGVTAVERLRTYDGRPFSVEQHVARFRQTLWGLHLGDTFECHDFAGLLSRLLSRNAATIDAMGDVGLTLFATAGVAGGGPTLAMHLNALDAKAIDRRRQHGVPLIITEIQQPAAACWPRHLKVRNRLHYHLADAVARAVDPDAAGLLVDADGSVTETSTANLAIVQRGQILSPPPPQVLPGVSLGRVQSIAASMGLSWRHQRLFEADLVAAAEIWLMGTDTGVWFANAVNEFAKHQPKLLRRIQDSWPGNLD